jgi:hypothetical protein
MSIFRKSVEKNQLSFNSDKNKGQVTRTPTIIYDSSSLNSLDKDMFLTTVAEKIKTHTLCSITFLFQKSCRLSDNVEKGRAGQGTDDNIAHELCMLDT